MRLNWKPYPLVCAYAACLGWGTDWHPPHPFVRHLLLGAYEIYAIPPARYTHGRAKGQVICENPAPRREGIKTYFRCPEQGKSVLKLHESLKRVGGSTSTYPPEFCMERYIVPREQCAREVWELISRNGTHYGEIIIYSSISEQNLSQISHLVDK